MGPFPETDVQCLQRHARREQALDDVVVQIAGDPVTFLAQRELRHRGLGVGELERDGGMIGERRGLVDVDVVEDRLARQTRHHHRSATATGHHRVRDRAGVVSQGVLHDDRLAGLDHQPGVRRPDRVPHPVLGDREFARRHHDLELTLVLGEQEQVRRARAGHGPGLLRDIGQRVARRDVEQVARDRQARLQPLRALAGLERASFLQLRDDPHVLHGDGGAVGQRLEQAALVRRREVGVRPVHTDRGNGFGAAHRRHRQRLDEGRAVCLVRDAVVDVDVGDDHLLRVQHRPARDAGRHREAQARPERLDRVLVDVVAAAVVPQHERRAVGIRYLAGGVPHDLHDVLEPARGGQVTDGADEALHSGDVRRAVGGLGGAGERRHGRYQSVGISSRPGRRPRRNGGCAKGTGP